MAGALAQAGFLTAVSSGIGELCSGIEAGAGAAVIAEEGLAGPASDLLDASLAAQPSWSDFPVILLLATGATLASSRQLLTRFSRHGNVTLLERPVRTVALISALQTAIRARRRQYQVRDYLSERAQAQAALEQSEARYRSLVLASVSIVWIADASGAIDSELPSWEAYTGQALEAYRGWGWLEAVHPEDRENAAAAWHRALAEKRAYFSEYRLRRHDGQFRRVTTRGVPVWGPDGNLVEWVGTCTDVEDERRVAEHLRQSHRIEAAGQLAGGMAHEVNNMMSAVIGFGQFALHAIPRDSQPYADVSEMVKAATRASGITSQLLAFTRQQVFLPKIVDVNEVITDLVPMLRGFLGVNVQLNLRLKADAARARADRGQLEQVLVNLALNAQYAMKSDGQLTLETADVVLDREDRNNVAVKPGNYVRITVTDTGCGMGSATLSRVFDPFYTTKPVGEGTGLGLSVVYGIVKQFGGYIWLSSEPGQGTSVEIYLPQVSEAVDLPASPETSAPRGAGETILVVEDEESVREITRRTLEKAGYRVLEAGNGREALQVLEAAGAKVNLVLCDVMMPEMSGQEFGSRLATANPQIPILYMSASPGSEMVQRGLLAEGVPFIGKPFSADDLAHAVRGMVEASIPR
jgi:PAS domain S-box-containing protein